MGESKQGLMVVEASKGVNIMQHQNPIVQILTKFKEIESGFNTWVSKQPLHIEVTAATAGGATQGAFLGGLMGAINGGMSSSMPMPPPSSSLNPEAMTTLQSSQDILVTFSDYLHWVLISVETKICTAIFSAALTALTPSSSPPPGYQT